MMCAAARSGKPFPLRPTSCAMEEKRRRTRQRTLKAGKIVFNDGQSVIDCRVRDLSLGGARLVVTTVVGVPDQFVLQVSGRPQQSCRIVWRRADEIGVAFS